MEAMELPVVLTYTKNLGHLLKMVYTHKNVVSFNTPFLKYINTIKITFYKFLRPENPVGLQPRG
jgi:hypothetical protein